MSRGALFGVAALGALLIFRKSGPARARDVSTGMVVFPVDGPTRDADPSGAPAGEGRTPSALQLFAPRGPPVRAPFAGSLTFQQGELSGLAALVRGEGVSAFLAHLDSREGSARTVRAGDVVGYVGDSGNAVGKGTHVHFELRQAGEIVNPYPVLKAAELSA